ncbi:MAG: hypothetical protein CGW95_10860 [Phenylobacterium zucineum]|nr:MAG: hypothetical protein CGW95_10860 [Phenylobacterium zucineum]
MEKSVVKAPTDNIDYRALINAAIESDKVGLVLEFSKLYWKSAPNASTSSFITARIEQLWPNRKLPEYRIAFLRSYTLEPALPLLAAEAALSGCRIATWVGGFNAYAQDILTDQGELYDHHPDAIVLAVDGHDIAPEIWGNFGQFDEDELREGCKQASSLLINMIDQLRNRTDASIIVHGMAMPKHRSGGLLDDRRTFSQIDAIYMLNRTLRLASLDRTGVYFLDMDELQGRHGRANWGDARKFATTRMPMSISALPVQAREWWRRLRPLALPPAKVLVLDLDNTLWGGTVGEDGPEGLKLSDEHPGVYFKNFQKAIADISRRGVLLAIASKNNPSDAMHVLEQNPHMILRPDSFSALRINWQPKPQNLIEIAEELNLGLDSLVFVDDNPAECEAVRLALPEVEVIQLPSDPASYADLILSVLSLERAFASLEDTQRAQFYSQDKARRELAGNYASIDDFLSALDIRIAISPLTKDTLSRASQLTQKTNQLNTTTRRLSEAEMAAFVAVAHQEVFTLRSWDKFGDNGIVGVAMTSILGTRCDIIGFMLSCRVIGRGIETAFLSWIGRWARSHGALTLEGEFIATKKNAPAEKIFENAGFTCISTRDSASTWRYDISNSGPETPAWVSWKA